MELFDIKKDIYKEINIIKDNHIKINKLYEFIEEKNIPRSFNSNGTFINLTVIDTKYIHLLSDFLLKQKDSKVIKESLIHDLDKEIKDINEEFKLIHNKKQKQKIQKVKIKDMEISKLEKHIIKFSH